MVTADRLQSWLEGSVGHCVFQQVWLMPFPEGRLTTSFSNGDLVRRDRDPFNDF